MINYYYDYYYWWWWSLLLWNWVSFRSRKQFNKFQTIFSHFVLNFLCVYLFFFSISLSLSLVTRNWMTMREIPTKHNSYFLLFIIKFLENEMIIICNCQSPRFVSVAATVKNHLWQRECYWISFFFNFAFKQHLVWFDLSKKNDYWFSTVIKFSFSFFFHPLSPILPPPPPASMLWSNEVKCVGRVSPGYTPTHPHTHFHTHTHTHTRAQSFISQDRILVRCTFFFSCSFFLRNNFHSF